LKEYNAFKKKSLATPTVEAKKTSSSDPSRAIPLKKKVKRKNELPAQNSIIEPILLSSQKVDFQFCHLLLTI